MQDPAPVRRGQSLTELPRDLDRLVARKPADAAQQRRKVLPVDVLHREEYLPGDLADVVHTAHVGMRDQARDPHLVEQPRQQLTLAFEILGQELQRHRLSESEVVRAINLSHPAPPQQRDDPIASEQRLARNEPRLAVGRPGGRLAAEPRIVAGRSRGIPQRAEVVDLSRRDEAELDQAPRTAITRSGSPRQHGPAPGASCFGHRSLESGKFGNRAERSPSLRSGSTHRRDTAGRLLHVAQRLQALEGFVSAVASRGSRRLSRPGPPAHPENPAPPWNRASRSSDRESPSSAFLSAPTRPCSAAC